MVKKPSSYAIKGENFGYLGHFAASENIDQGHNTMRSKVGKVMREYRSGDLYSSSGNKVTKRAQAVAIALSEARQVKKKKKV